MTATSTPMGGDLAKGGADGEPVARPRRDVAAARSQTQTVNVFTLTRQG